MSKCAYNKLGLTSRVQLAQESARQIPAPQWNSRPLSHRVNGREFQLAGGPRNDQWAWVCRRPNMFPHARRCPVSSVGVGWISVTSSDGAGCAGCVAPVLAG